jgi:hypothetical protein
MIKAGLFSFGLGSGVYLGISLREKGFTAGLMRAYQAYKDDPLARDKLRPEKLSFDQIYEYYRAGLLDEENMLKFKSMLLSKRYDKIDEIAVNELNSILDESQIDELRRLINTNIYKK